MQLKIEIAKHERMSESGSSLLRLIQNQNTPLLDLFVRESIQNSLDAAKSENLPVNIEFNFGKFDAKELNCFLEGIEQPLNRKFNKNGKVYNFIGIRDSNTTGLTGPSSYEDVVRNPDGKIHYGNLLNLIYEICKPQTNEGAGGSWGLGKTIYFRLGIGLVIYYTRIHENNQYRSKLAACFVENENNPDAILPEGNGIRRGIAWWGDISENNKSVPIENEEEIEKILQIFGIEPYRMTTGTTVIIPYIDEKILLDEVYSDNDSANEFNKPYWTNNILDYLEIAIQRWYAPRLNNSKYQYGPFFKASINGKKINSNEMLPLFKIVRELYIKANGIEVDDSFVLENGAEIIVEDIKTRGCLQQSSAGMLAYVKMNREQLQMLPPNNIPSPYYQIDNSCNNGEEFNSPIIMFTRKPGMVVGYDYNSTWTHGMYKTNTEEYIIGIFVANSYNIVNCEKKMILDEYIRAGEKADHTSWADHSEPGLDKRIISNIQSQVIRKINSRFNSQSIEKSVKKHIGLSHALADILLPSYNFGKRPTHQETVTPESKNKNTDQRKSNFEIQKITNKKSNSLKLGKPKFSNDGILVPFALFIKDLNEVKLELLLNTDYTKYNSASWESSKGVGKPFPLFFTKFVISEIIDNDQKFNLDKDDVGIDHHASVCNTSDVHMEFIKDRITNMPSIIKIKPKKEQIQFNGILAFRSTDASVKWIVEISKQE